MSGADPEPPLLGGEGGEGGEAQVHFTEVRSAERGRVKEGLPPPTGCMSNHVGEKCRKNNYGSVSLYNNSECDRYGKST